MCLSLVAVSFGGSHTVFVVSGVFFGIASGAGFPILVALISDIFHKPLQPKGTSSTFFMFDAGCFMTPVIIGYLTQMTDIVAAFRMLCAFVLLTLLSLQFFFWMPFYLQKKRSKTNQNDGV